MKYLLIFLLFSISSATLAGPAGYETQLIKLSKALKGEPPSLEERQELRSEQAKGNAEAYLQKKTKEYVQNEKFSFKLKQKINELVRVKTSLENPRVGDYGNSIKNTYDFFLDELLAENASWDSLLLSKKYKAYFSGDGRRPEPTFYQNLTSSHLEESIEQFFKERDDGVKAERTIYKYDFPANDQRLAGIITTPIFFDRYANTALNKNRRRAAAVFRIFLCDTMIATAPIADSNSQIKDFDTIFPDHKNLTEDDIRKSAAGNVHGEQVDCMKCHYKLDPLGQVFAFSGASLSPTPSSGALAYQGKDLRKVNIPLKGFGDLAQKLTQQPEYLQCQVSHFWRWYVGKDKPITPEVEKELVAAFEKSGRKPREFVSYLVSRPEFKEKPQVLSEGQILAHRVTTTFKSCQSCHDSQGENVWDLTSLPYGKDQSSRDEAIKTLRKVLDIEHDGARAEMPPSDSLWKPSKDEIQNIKRWLELGAPDFEGKPQVATKGGQ